MKGTHELYTLHESGYNGLKPLPLKRMTNTSEYGGTEAENGICISVGI